jgi:hypothetical protein
VSQVLAIRDFRAVGFGEYDTASTPTKANEATLHQLRNYLEASASDWRRSAIAALRDIGFECAAENWDGEGAVAISVGVIGVAGRILDVLFDLLPKGTPMPDVLPEADGEIDIGWIVDATRMFSLSVGARGKINFAGQLGKGGSVHAWQPIDASSREALAESLQDVVRYVARLFAQSHDGGEVERIDKSVRA